MPPEQNDAILILDDGTTFRGRAAGKKGTTIGEICFNTGMTGYQEVFSDPSYHGQILIMTNAHIGNYGAKNDDLESNGRQIAGLICKNFTTAYSRKVADQSIDEFAEDFDLIGISDVDTRALVAHVRTKGAMNAIISSDNLNVEQLKEELGAAPSMEGLELASKVSTKTPFDFGNEEAPHRIAVLDLGTKKNILRCFSDRGCFLRVFPAKTPFDELESWGADGYFLSNGPGDPASMQYAIEAASKMLDSGKPVFGICLGHQILALANGVKTYKMHHGHRGINHPVKNVMTGKCEITSQNHGFGVDAESLRKNEEIEVTHINLNDDTVEGIRLKDRPAFSVQFHPEAAPGPHDSRYLFDQFIQEIVKYKN